MEAVSTTRMSSKGQVVIPEEVREQLGLKSGDHFAVVGQGDVVILKVIARPSMKEFDALVRKTRAQAKSAELRRSDITKAVRKARIRR